MQVNDLSPVATPMPLAPAVRYQSDNPHTLLATPGVLALFGFDQCAPRLEHPCYVRVPLDYALEPPIAATPQVLETWRIDGTVESGREDGLTWSSGGGWLFVSLDIDESAFAGIQDASAYTYQRLVAFLGQRGETHVQRIWNYLGAINQGTGDAERYKRFCAGRAQGMGDFFADGFPAATAIGHRRGDGHLQVYALASTVPGARVENPRQMSAWHYPPQYGSTAPRFARAMRLPGNDALAISGTAAIIGHQSQHDDDLHAQLDETLSNLQALLQDDANETFDAEGVLKVYLRHQHDAAAVDAVLAERLPRMSRLLLLGDICRSELLVEIDGWRFR